MNMDSRQVFLGVRMRHIAELGVKLEAFMALIPPSLSQISFEGMTSGHVSPACVLYRYVIVIPKVTKKFLSFGILSVIFY